MIPGILTRLSTVGQASFLNTVHTGHFANAALLERGCWARVTPRRRWPEPHSSGRNQSTGISANRPTTSFRAPGSRQNR